MTDGVWRVDEQVEIGPASDGEVREMAVVPSNDGSGAVFVILVEAVEGVVDHVRTAPVLDVSRSGRAPNWLPRLTDNGDYRATINTVTNRTLVWSTENTELGVRIAVWRPGEGFRGLGPPGMTMTCAAPTDPTNPLGEFIVAIDLNGVDPLAGVATLAGDPVPGNGAYIAVLRPDDPIPFRVLHSWPNVVREIVPIDGERVLVIGLRDHGVVPGGRSATMESVSYSDRVPTFAG